MRLRRLAVVVAIAGGCALAAAWMGSARFFDATVGQLELVTLDLRMRSAADSLPRDASDVILVLFDGESVMDWPYLVPFPRTVLADLVDVAARAGARSIGLDVFLERRYPELDPLGEGDEKLREAIRRAGNVILAAPTEPGESGRVLQEPDPYFAQVAAGVGTADLPTPYETVRDAVLAVHTEGGSVPGFALALWAHARGVALDSWLAEADGDGHLPVPGLPRRYAAMPGPDNPVLTVPILFVGPPSRPGDEKGAFLAIGASHARWVPHLFHDRIVLLGSGFHAEERFRTPFYSVPDDGGTIAGWTYGVEVHANMLENLLAERHPAPVFEGAWLLLPLGLLTLMTAGTTFWRGAGLGGGVAFGFIAIWIAGAWWAFDAHLLNLPVITPALAVGLAFLGSTSYVSVVEGRDKRAIRSAFSKYVSPAVVEELVVDPSRLKLGGEKRQITILFSDLAGFTTLSESMEPDQLVHLLNEYLDEMADTVLAEAGTLDKYIGDAVMALFGAPAAQPDHALRACRAALHMQRRLLALNAGWETKGLPELHMRIGINTGSPVVGNIGGEKRFDYTALGDPVNLAARLEPACKLYGVDILASGSTVDQAGSALVTRELDLLAVYGKRKPVGIHEIVGLAGEVDEDRLQLLDLFREGVQAYRGHRFAEGLQVFQAALELEPDDVPARIYSERCQGFIHDPPPADWDGVERRHMK